MECVQIRIEVKCTNKQHCQVRIKENDVFTRCLVTPQTMKQHSNQGRNGLENMTWKETHWRCHSCTSEIFPKIEINTCPQSKPKISPKHVNLLTYVQLRESLENDIFQVDSTYKSMATQRDLQENILDILRRDETIFWNLVYYFSKYKYRFEFMLPYSKERYDRKSIFQVYRK